MAKFLVLSVLFALGSAAPHHLLGAAPLAAVETIHAGPAVAETIVHHGVVGSRTVQVGSQQVLAGHQYVVAGKSLEQQPAFAYVAGEPKSYSSTVQLPAPVIPAPAGPIIPPAPRNYGPAPADTVTQEKILAPVRTHSIITPQVKRIEPELQVNRIAVEVPVANPVPVEREVIIQKHVAKPYTVEVEHPVPVAQPYKVHPVHQVVETPVIDHTTFSVHQPVVAAAPVAHIDAGHFAYAHGFAAAPIAVAAEGLVAAAPVAAEAVAVADA